MFLFLLLLLFNNVKLKKLTKREVRSFSKPGEWAFKSAKSSMYLSQHSISILHCVVLFCFKLSRPLNTSWSWKWGLCPWDAWLPVKEASKMEKLQKWQRKEIHTHWNMPENWRGVHIPERVSENREEKAWDLMDRQGFFLLFRRVGDNYFLSSVLLSNLESLSEKNSAIVNIMGTVCLPLI